MKRIFVMAMLLPGMMSCVSFSSFAQHAQKGDNMVGMGIVYGTYLETMGLQFNYYRIISKNASLGGDITFFFPLRDDSITSSNNAEEDFRELTFTLFALNAVIRFHPVRINLNNTSQVRLYALTGLDLASDGFKVTTSTYAISESTLELSFNLGGGIEVATPIGVFFTEAKVVSGGLGYVAITSEFYQEVLGVGYRYSLGS